MEWIRCVGSYLPLAAKVGVQEKMWMFFLSKIQELSTANSHKLKGVDQISFFVQMVADYEDRSLSTG